MTCCFEAVLGQVQTVKEHVDLGLNNAQDYNIKVILERL